MDIKLKPFLVPFAARVVSISSHDTPAQEKRDCFLNRALSLYTCMNFAITCHKPAMERKTIEAMERKIHATV